MGLLVQVDTLCHIIPNFIEKCKRAGVTRVFIGLENINPDNLMAAKKRQNKITEYRKMLLAWKEQGIMTLAGYIHGFPNDTEERSSCAIAQVPNPRRLIFVPRRLIPAREWPVVAPTAPSMANTFLSVLRSTCPETRSTTPVMNTNERPHPADLNALKAMIGGKLADSVAMQRLVNCNLIEEINGIALLTASGLRAAAAFAPTDSR